MLINLDDQHLQTTKYLSYSYTIEQQDLNRLFANSQAYQGERFFWKSADERITYLGIQALETFTDADFDKIQQFQQSFKENCTLISPLKQAPILFGGFPFDTKGAKETFWNELEAGYFQLPKILFTKTQEQTIVTLTIVNAPDTQQQFNRLAMLVSELVEATPAEADDSVALTTEELAVPEWLQLVEDSLAAIEANRFKKVVLARQLKATHPQQFNRARILANLFEQQPNTYTFLLEGPTRSFIGATPERLVEATPEHFATASVAGSTPRGKTPEEDDRLGLELLDDPKNSYEHGLVVNRIEQELAPFIEQMTLGERRLLKNRDIQHIYLPLFGKRKAGVTLLDVIKALHPTPALGGEPRQAALEWLAEKELAGRGLYGAPIGWLSLMEDIGEFAVGLRSGVFSENEGIFYAGCGIVADSVPELERQETKIKFQPMLRGVQ